MIGPLAYIGGKRRLARHICTLLPPHITYVEPFAGGAQVFFHKPPSRVEVLNDLDGELVNFLRVCREHPEELIRVLRYLVPSRAVFGQFAAQDPSLLTDVQRAARLLYLQKNTFGGSVTRRSFHYGVKQRINYDPDRLPAIIDKAAHRLRHVQLENWPYERVLDRYDRPTTVFYLDPPYAGLALYRFNFSEIDFHTLATRLAALRGRFFLSLNDTPAVRQIFQSFPHKHVSLPYTATPAVPQVQELLFTNIGNDI